MTGRLLLLTALLTLGCMTLFLPSAKAGEDPPAAEIRRDLERTLDLWHERSFSELYDRVIGNGGKTKEYFISHLAAAPRTPACCWEKLQEVRVSVKDERQATLQGKFGFDTGAGGEFMTRKVKLEKDDGIWKMKMADLLSMAGKGMKVHKGKKKVHKE